jgi:MoaE-MoaD fusion protein
MRVRVLFFGQLKEIVGRAVDDVDLADGARVEELFARYGAEHPQLTGFRGSVVASVNQEFADWQAPLAGGDEVAFLPPVSGGTEPAAVERGADICELVRQTIRVAELVARLKAPEDGALVVFEGITRNHSKGRRTLYLDYEAYEPMALAKLGELGREMRAQFPINRIALVHRLGRIDIGETSIFIGVSSPHRPAAFEACRFGIDTLKRTVPIWKKEYFEDGAAWPEGEVPVVPSISRPSESKT